MCASVQMFLSPTVQPNDANFIGPLAGTLIFSVLLVVSIIVIITILRLVLLYAELFLVIIKYNSSTDQSKSKN